MQYTEHIFYMMHVLGKINMKQQGGVNLYRVINGSSLSPQKLYLIACAPIVPTTFKVDFLCSNIHCSKHCQNPSPEMLFSMVVTSPNVNDD